MDLYNNGIITNLPSYPNQNAADEAELAFSCKLDADRVIVIAQAKFVLIQTVSSGAWEVMKRK